MHDTRIELRDGRVLEAPLWQLKLNLQDFEESTLQLVDHDPIAIKDIESAITFGERISLLEIGDVDELSRIRSLWEWEKKNHGFDDTENGL